MPGKAQQIVILRARLEASETERARLAGLYDATVAANGRLQEQVIALAAREPAAEGIVREVMAGFQAVMAPTVVSGPAEAPSDLFGDLQRQLAAMPAADPAWEVPGPDWPQPDGYADVLEREGIEDA